MINRNVLLISTTELNFYFLSIWFSSRRVLLLAYFAKEGEISAEPSCDASSHVAIKNIRVMKVQNAPFLPRIYCMYMSWALSKRSECTLCIDREGKHGIREGTLLLGWRQKKQSKRTVNNYLLYQLSYISTMFPKMVCWFPLNPPGQLQYKSKKYRIVFAPI